MNLRALFLLLAFVLVWSGQAADRAASSSASIAVLHHEGHSAAAVTHQATALQGEASPAGQTTRAAEEVVIDLVGLLPPDTDAPASSLVMAGPMPYTARAWIAPYLDGLQRPPRATLLLA